jgi:gamma-glutamylcyclotransferase (GGCT)/AIG2-like uncharacterized protein YtfP
MHTDRLDPAHTHIFVYGTLKPGESNFDRYCQNAIQIQEAIVHGTLYDFPALGYPAMTSGAFPIYGFLLSFPDPKILTALDELEDYAADRPPEQNEYYRQKIQTFSLSHQSLGKAWGYLMEPEKAKRLGGVLLSEGRWSERKTGHA